MITFSGGNIGASTTKGHSKYAVEGTCEASGGGIAVETYNIDREIAPMTKFELISAMTEDCHSERQRRNGIVDRRVMFSPISQVTKLMSPEQLLSFCRVVMTQELPDWRGYLMCHKREDGSKHIHGLFSVYNTSGERIDLSAKKLEKIHEKYNKLLEEFFPEQVKEYREAQKEKVEKLTTAEKRHYEETGLLPGHNSIRKKKTILVNGKIEIKIEKNIEVYKAQAKEQEIYTLTEVREILKSATQEKQVLWSDEIYKISKTLDIVGKSEYCKTKRGEQFLTKVKNEYADYKKFSNYLQEKNEVSELKKEVIAQYEELQNIHEKVKAAAEEEIADILDDYFSTSDENK